MSWARIDDGFDEHVKVESIFDEEEPMFAMAAIGLWTLTLARAHRESSGARRRKLKNAPGFIHRAMVRTYLGREDRDIVTGILVKHGLWDSADDGWMIHDFADYEADERTREERAAAGRKGAAKRWGLSPNVDTEVWQTDGVLLQPDGKLLQPDGKLLENDSKAIASYGSHAPPRRGPVPVPKNPLVVEEVDSLTLPQNDLDKADPTEASGAAPRGGSATPLFARFWAEYPRKRDKADALRAWDKLTRVKGPGKVSAEVLIAAARNYRTHCERNRIEERFRKHPATFLNSGDWESFSTTPVPDETAAPGSPGLKNFWDA